MNASAITRIAKIIPLAVVAAVGVTACGPTNGGASLAAPATNPAATSSTTPAPATPTTEAAPTTPAETATAKTDTKTAAKTAAKTATKTTSGTSGTGGIAITFNGLNQNGQIGLGDLVPFSVTWKNNDTTGTRSIVPV
ncbi:hypothetical protein AB0E96_23560, partial [Kitasatospora sp. NPDC036755]|uniref:hypothetical protein n=1 Tax=Kitasatospora sp. NPDC036755 TaxID=3154600 RepID=UPI0033F1DC69